MLTNPSPTTCPDLGLSLVQASYAEAPHHTSLIPPQSGASGSSLQQVKMGPNRLDWVLGEDSSCDVAQLGLKLTTALSFTLPCFKQKREPIDWVKDQKAGESGRRGFQLFNIRMPVQYILGEWDFQGLSLKMIPPVFIPRPETEELVEWVLGEVAQKPPTVGAQGGPLILEVGCGSGAIALSLLSQLPESQVIAVDKEEAAVSLTRENAQRLQLQDRIRIIPLDVTSEGCWAHLLPWGPVDLVVSNPPYIFHKDMEQLAPEICSYEDLVALDGGEEGMDVITHILTLAPQLLNASGSIFLEVDPRHPELVNSWLQRRPDLHLSLVAVRKDFCGRVLSEEVGEDSSEKGPRIPLSGHK
ncbi:hypothetical protein STEG23_030653 [Scotinomys teguina]